METDASALVAKLKDFFKASGKSKAVLGLSGGVDSALVLKLCAEALGAQNVYAFYLPYFENGQDRTHAENWAKELGAHFALESIQKPVDAFCEIAGKSDDVSRGNFMARTRMAFLYNVSRQHEALVVGTGNKSELKTGYFTKYGDGGVDVLPIGGLYKTEVWQMARDLGIPAHFIDKAPSAGLWEGQTDEAELGLSYLELDQILQLMETKPNAAVTQFGPDKVKLVLERMLIGEHKSKMAPVL
ncbi:NAD+ synthase [Candidatus Micrarchaeota archaeon]|nr:NAD+ synthase [Candidatus Micrarchaeota archaeon]